jgi:acyl dehydratase
LLAHTFPEVRHRYQERDAILYALGVGLGSSPTASEDLAYVYEKNLRVLPTMAVTLASPGMWVRAPELAIAWEKLLHVAQNAKFHAALPSQGEVIGRARIASVTDLGKERGAEVIVERTIADVASGALLCTVEQVLRLRGNGGFSAAPASRPPSSPLPDREPDQRVRFATSPRAALIYRLSGDWNPLHADPAIAARAGFQRPILHGLASYGLAGWVILKSFAHADAARLKALSLRFASPVMPGDTLDFEVWQSAENIMFRALVDGRPVLDQGNATLA